MARGSNPLLGAKTPHGSSVVLEPPPTKRLVGSSILSRGTKFLLQKNKNSALISLNQQQLQPRLHNERALRHISPIKTARLYKTLANYDRARNNHHAIYLTFTRAFFWSVAESGCSIRLLTGKTWVQIPPGQPLICSGSSVGRAVE